MEGWKDGVVVVVVVGGALSFWGDIFWNWDQNPPTLPLLLETEAGATRKP